MASYPSTPVAFPTRLPGAACDQAHWNLMSDEVAALELALMASSAQTSAFMRPRGFSPALEWGHGTPGYGCVLASGYGTCGAVYLLSEPGATASTIKTRGQKGSVLTVDAAGTFIVGAAPAASADNQVPTQQLTLTQAGVLGFPGQPRVLLQKNDATTLGVSTWTDLAWPLELSDPQAFHAAGGGGITVGAGYGGTYLISVVLGITQAGGTVGGVGLNRVSGAAPTGRLATVFHASPSWGVNFLRLETIQLLTAGDQYSIQAWQNDAATATINSASYASFVRLPV